ncbi:MAG: CHAD domain-containing protein [Magnetospirillum sp.]|nr:CHAD domain-containing protein [Magnetospirillum sp.]
MARLKRQPFLHEGLREPARTVKLVSTYFDTPERTLAAAGITVRVRAEGRRQLQTVKTAGERAGGLFSRAEWEGPLAGTRPDPDFLCATGLGPLADPALAGWLEPTITTTVSRQRRRIGGDGWEVEVAFDSGHIEAGTAREEVCEVEFELIAGPPSALFALASQVVEAVPARLLADTKSDRGFRLAAGIRPAPVKAQTAPLDPGMSAAQAFQAIARGCLHHLLVNEHCLRATGESEAIHQMRVALRRLRSAIKVFRPIIAGPAMDTIGEELRRLLGHLGPARDHDVFLAEILAPVLAIHPDDAVLALLAEHWRQRRDQGRAEALAAVDEPRFARLLLDIAAWIETAPGWPPAEPLVVFATRALAKRETRMRRAGGRGLSALAPGELHRVRILGKQLRYAGEFFAPLFRRRAGRDYLDVLAAVQEVLGQLNDIAVARARLIDSHKSDGLGWAAGQVAGWHEARRPALMSEAERLWKRLRKARRFWER